MASSGYIADTFIAGEQPTTAKWNELWSNDAAFNSGNGLNDGAIVTRTLADSAVTFSKLLSTTFSDNVTSLANAGTAGGTMKYINLGGIKLLWGKTASQAVGTGGATWNVTFPSSFFSAIQASLVTEDVLGTSIQQNAYISSINTSGMVIGQWSVANGSSQTNSYFIVGA